MVIPSTNLCKRTSKEGSGRECSHESVVVGQKGATFLISVPYAVVDPDAYCTESSAPSLPAAFQKTIATSFMVTNHLSDFTLQFIQRSLRLRAPSSGVRRESILRSAVIRGISRAWARARK